LFVDVSVNPVTSKPIISAMSPVVGPIAGGSVITVTGVNLDMYPALGAYFNDPELPALYGYALLNSR
jgi:IPT/TIG domain